MPKKTINIIGIPYDLKSSFMQGPSLGPDKIRETFHDGSANYFAENGVDIKHDITLIDKGNLPITKYEEIKPAIAQHLSTSEKFIFMGEITQSLFLS